MEQLTPLDYNYHLLRSGFGSTCSKTSEHFFKLCKSSSILSVDRGGSENDNVVVLFDCGCSRRYIVTRTRRGAGHIGEEAMRETALATWAIIGCPRFDKEEAYDVIQSPEQLAAINAAPLQLSHDDGQERPTCVGYRSIFIPFCVAEGYEPYEGGLLAVHEITFSDDCRRITVIVDNPRFSIESWSYEGTYILASRTGPTLPVMGEEPSEELGGDGVSSAKSSDEDLARAAANVARDEYLAAREQYTERAQYAIYDVLHDDVLRPYDGPDPEKHSSFFGGRGPRQL